MSWGRHALERVRRPNAPIRNAVGCEDAAHENGCATAPNPRLDEISGYSRPDDFFNAKLKVIESLSPNHGVRQLRIIPSSGTGVIDPSFSSLFKTIVAPRCLDS